MTDYIRCLGHMMGWSCASECKDDIDNLKCSNYHQSHYFTGNPGITQIVVPVESDDNEIMEFHSVLLAYLVEEMT